MFLKMVSYNTYIRIERWRFFKKLLDQQTYKPHRGPAITVAIINIKEVCWTRLKTGKITDFQSGREHG